MASRAAERIASSRQGITKLAVVGDVGGLRDLADRLPPTLEFAYERQRARALALALEGRADEAVAALEAGVTSGLQPSSFAGDLAEISLVSGDPRGAVAALAAGLPELPTASSRMLGAGLAAGAASAFGAAGRLLRIERPFNDRFRIAAGAASLAAAVAALLFLPRTLDSNNGGRTATQLARPDTSPPSVVRVASPPAPTQGSAGSRAREDQALGAAEEAPTGTFTSFGGGSPQSERPTFPAPGPRRPGPSAPPSAPPATPPATPSAPTPAPDAGSAPSQPTSAASASPAPSPPARPVAQVVTDGADGRERSKEKKAKKDKPAKVDKGAKSEKADKKAKNNQGSSTTASQPAPSDVSDQQQSSENPTDAGKGKDEDKDKENKDNGKGKDKD